MRPTDVLENEHRVIERVLTVVETACHKLTQGEAVDADVFTDAVDFIRSFADRWHHGKEEDELFAMMGQRGIPRDGGPVGMMLWEHDQGRTYVAALAAAAERLRGGDPAATTDVVANGCGYAQLLRHHIMKEDHILYPMANNVLTAGDQEELTRRFARVERSLGADVAARYTALAAALERRVGVGASQPAGGCACGG